MDRGAAAAAQGLFDHLGQVQRPGERLFGAAPQDGGGDAARLALVAVELEDMGQRAVVPAVDDVRRGLALVGHPHVQRPVAHEGKAALGLVQLHRRHADVEHHPVQLRLAAPGERSSQARERRADQTELARKVVGDRVRMRLHRRIAVEGDDGRAGSKDGAGVAAGAEGGVDDHIAGPRGQGLQHLGQQDGSVRAHAPSPPGRRPASSALRPASPRSRTACRASARRSSRRAFQRARSQIWKRDPRPTITTSSPRPAS